MDVSIGQAYYREACYLYSKTGHFACECFNQKAQIKAVLYTMTNKKKQIQVDKVRELNESSAEEKQPAKKAPFKEDFMEAQV